MPNKRPKIVNTSIDDGRATINCYSDPANGEQHVTTTLIYDMRNLATPTILNLAAVAFVSIIGNRYHGNETFPDVPSIAQTAYDEMVGGNWEPGKRDTKEGKQPTDLMLALAEATHTPLHVIAHEFETRMEMLSDGRLYIDKAGKTRRFFSAAMQRQLAADPAVAPIIARLAQERAKATLATLRHNKEPSKLATLFSMAPSEPQVEAAQ